MTFGFRCPAGPEMSDSTSSSQRGWAQALLITGIQELWSFGGVLCFELWSFPGLQISLESSVCAGGYAGNPWRWYLIPLT